METLTLNDGTVLENSTALESNDSLFIYTRNGYTIQGLCDDLYPAENISMITAEFQGGSRVYTDYSKLISLRDEGNDLVTAVLRKSNI